MARIGLKSLQWAAKMRWTFVFVSLAIVTAYSCLLLLDMFSISPRNIRPDYLPVATSNLTDSPTEVRPDGDAATPGAFSQERYAYVTWLSSPIDSDSENLDADRYFIATRILVWQILHDPTTRTSIADMVVMVSSDVSESRRERLRRDGAIVRPIDSVHGKDDAWIIPLLARWREVMDKLRVWELEEYSRVLMLDSDMLLHHPLDDIFNDPAAQTLYTKTWLRDSADFDLPETYMLGTYGQIIGPHAWPPPPSDHHLPGYFNAGFFLLRPSRRLFNYLVTLLDAEGRFDPSYPEQNLLNYAFRWNGPMPWREINNTWNIRWTKQRDIKGGVVSMHEKWWTSKAGDSSVKDFGIQKRWEMNGFYIAHDRIQG